MLGQYIDPRTGQVLELTEAKRRRDELRTLRLAAEKDAKARDATGRRDLRLHDLRRICAQLIAGAGRPLAGLKELLGHAAIKMTEEYATSEAGAKDAAAIADSLAPITKVLQLRRAQ